MSIIETLLLYTLPLLYNCLALVVLLARYISSGFKVLGVKYREKSPKILQDPKYGKHHDVHLKDRGIKIHYVEKGNSKNPLLLCLHGFPEFWFSWRLQLEELSTNFWVVAVDLRGYGDTTKPLSLSSYSHENAAKDIKSFIEFLDHPDCTLVSHDFGAVFAWRLLTYHPEVVKRHVAINGPHAGITKAVRLTNVRQFFMSWYIYLFQMPWLPETMLRWDDMKFFEGAFRADKHPLVYTPEVIEAYKYTFSKQNAFTAALNYYRQTFYDDLGDREQVSVPTLIIWGDQDTALCTDIAIKMKALCKNARLEFIEGAGHFVQQEEAKKVNLLIREFCQKQRK